MLLNVRRIFLHRGSSVGKRPGDPDLSGIGASTHERAGEIQPGSVAGILSGQGLEKNAA